MQVRSGIGRKGYLMKLTLVLIAFPQSGQGNLLLQTIFWFLFISRLVTIEADSVPNVEGLGRSFTMNRC